jgi:hypothetical protein
MKAPSANSQFSMNLQTANCQMTEDRALVSFPAPGYSLELGCWSLGLFA